MSLCFGELTRKTPAQLNDNFMYVKDHVPVFGSLNGFKYAAGGQHVKTFGDLYNTIVFDGIATSNWLFSDPTVQPQEGLPTKIHGTHSLPNTTDSNGRAHCYIEWGQYDENELIPATQVALDKLRDNKNKLIDVKRPKKLPLGFKFSDLSEKTIEKMGSWEYQQKTRRIFAKVLKNCAPRQLMDIMVINK